MSPEAALVAALVLSAPWALVLLLALARGYSITVVLSRRARRQDDR